MIYPLDCVAVMRGLIAPESVDACVTDPPYELGFMGKRWDASGIAFDPETWRAAYAVLKPGAHLVAFSGTRTYHRMACAIEDAGFEIRDQIGWAFGTGFPKSHNGEWGGTALKPAWEPICVARKPLIGTVAENFARYGTGGLDIDGCRIDAESRRIGNYRSEGSQGCMSHAHGGGKSRAGEPREARIETAGRWPANLCHDGSDEVLGCFPQAPGQQRATTERSANAVYGTSSPGTAGIEPRNDSGSAARFFYCAKASTAEREAGCDALPPKRADEQHKRDRSELDDPRRATVPARRNHHPTVKPVALMRWLARLVTPPGGTVLDPFTGSGSTGMARKAEGFQFIGCEMEPEYVAIAQARINAYQV